MFILSAQLGTGPGADSEGGRQHPVSARLIYAFKLAFNFGIQELCNFYGRHKEWRTNRITNGNNFAGKSSKVANATRIQSTLNSNPI